MNDPVQPKFPPCQAIILQLQITDQRADVTHRKKKKKNQPVESLNKEKAGKEMEKINKHLQKICLLFFWL